MSANAFDSMDRICAHARAWGIDDHCSSVDFRRPVPEITLRSNDIASFQRWARHLGQHLIKLHVGGPRMTWITVSGAMLRGFPVTVTVFVSHQLPRQFTGEHYLAVGELDQIMRGMAVA